MLTIQIRNALEVNGQLIAALAHAELEDSLDHAERYLRSVLGRSCIYRVERETPETVAVRSCFRGAVAYVGAES